MSTKNLIRLRWFTYSSFIVLWCIMFYLVKTGNFHFFSGLDWIVYYVTALAWATAGSIILFWQHRRKKNPPRRPHDYQLNWTTEDGIFAPRETQFYGSYGGMRSAEQPMSYWLSLEESTPTP